MNKIFCLFLLLSFVLLPGLCLAQEEAKPAEATETEPAVEQEAAQGTEKKEEVKVKFAPSNRRDPFLSRDEVATIERNRRLDIDKKEKERKAREDAIKAAQRAEEERLKKEEYLKANPHLAVMSKIKIQGLMGDEAQINNDFKAVGDKVLGATITKITSSRVYFRYKGKDFSLSMPKPKD